MSGAQTPRSRRARAVVRLRPRQLQAIFAIATALVLVVVTLVDAEIWDYPYAWITAVAVGVATALAIIARWVQGLIVPMSYLVPAVDLAALLVLTLDPHAPRVIAMLAVVPAFWLGLVVRRIGIAIALAGGLAVAVAMALRIPGSSGVTLTANAVGVVLVPLALFAAAWFADSFSATVERQQRRIQRREAEKLSLAKAREADAQLLDAIFDTARVGLLLLDPEGRIVRANPTLVEHPALGGDDVLSVPDGARYLELDSRRPMAPSESPFARAARGESFDNVVFWLDRAGRDQFAITMSSRPLFVDGDFRGSIASVDDVTTYMRMLEDRDDFVSLVSHELRTPLTSITGYLELVLEEELPETLAAWLRIVQRNSERLRSLVEDLLLVGEMSRGEVHLQPERVRLDTIAVEAIALLDHRARGRGVALVLEHAEPLEVEADRRRIAQVVENLVSNGIKYTRDAGSVRVRVEADGADAVVSVTDDGAGIDAAECERVFERFYRTQSARASGVQGAGLGLWICRMIVQEHGGEIDFTSERGVGSVVSFRLPLGD